jgi:hypothetical protein
MLPDKTFIDTVADFFLSILIVLLSEILYLTMKSKMSLNKESIYHIRYHN